MPQAARAHIAYSRVKIKHCGCCGDKNVACGYNYQNKTQFATRQLVSNMYVFVYLYFPCSSGSRATHTHARTHDCGSPNPKWDSIGRVRTHERARRVGWIIVRLHRGTRAKHTWIGLGHRRTSRFSSRDDEHSLTHSTRQGSQMPNASTLKARNAKGEHARGKEARRRHSSATTKHVHAL
jgi:hypothetical protein